MPRKLTPAEIDSIIDQIRKELEARGVLRGMGKSSSPEPPRRLRTMMYTKDAEDELAIDLMLD